MVLVGLVRADGTPVYGVATDMDGVTPERVDAQHFRFVLRFARLPLLPGKYFVRAHALDPEGVRLFDNVEIAFMVDGETRELGLARIDHAWGAPATAAIAPSRPGRRALIARIAGAPESPGASPSRLGPMPTCRSAP